MNMKYKLREGEEMEKLRAKATKIFETRALFKN